MPVSAGISIETLTQDIQNLITTTRAEFSQNPHDPSIPTRLKALQDLFGIVQSTSLPPDQLELIKNKVNELAAVNLRSLPQHSKPAVPPQPRPAPVAPSPAPPAQAPVTLDTLLGQGALAALMARGPTQTTPIPPPVAIRSPPPTHVEPPKPVPAAPANPMALMDQLRMAGLLSTPASTPVPPPPAPPSFIPANIASILASAKAAAAQKAPVNSGINAAMLKIP